MEINLTIENYRCFPSKSPASLKLTNGFSALIGVNNSGKSSLLKFFYEMRSVFQNLAGTDAIKQAFAGITLPCPTPPEVLDRDEIFFNGNQDDIRFDVRLAVPAQPLDIVSTAIFQVQRSAPSCTATFFTSGGREMTTAQWQKLSYGNADWAGDVLRGTAAGNPTVARFEDIRSAFKILAETYYVPAFRHISPLVPADGAVQSYYDINVGRPFIDAWHGLQTGSAKQGRERIYRLVDEIRDIFGFKNFQISAAMNRNSLQLLIEGKPFSLQELGAGIAQFIIVLGNAAFRKPSFIL